MESAPASTEWTGVEWGGYNPRGPLEIPVGETSTDIGTGNSNTTKIVQALEGQYYQSAAKFCKDLEVIRDGEIYADWFLPSKDELNQMYQVLRLSNLGGFESGYSMYWSSSEDSIAGAWCQSFNDGRGDQAVFGKDDPRKARAVRVF
jgi:hypothetical protein